MATQTPLAAIDGNKRLAANDDPKAANPLDGTTDKPVPTFTQESKQHQSLHSKLMRQEQSGKQVGTYVSPSDDILSPASAKLNAFKEKRFSKSAKPRTLFAKAGALSYSPDTKQ